MPTQSRGHGTRAGWYNADMEALTFLEKAGKAKPLPLYVLYGEEDFLKRQVLQFLRDLVLGPDGDELGLSVHAGDRAVFASVYDELQTVPFFSPRRLVIVENAEPFVSRHRELLEKVLNRLPSSGTLVLDVKSWPANTRLARQMDSSATIQCKGPPAYKLPAWCVAWCQARHNKKLTQPAAELLVELVGPEMGQLDQELAKLAVYVGERTRLDADDVDKLVGSSRTESTWKIFDAIGAGKLDEALALLDRLLDQGEDPLRILGAFSMQLRRLAQVGRLQQQGRSLAAALEQAGVLPFQARGVEQQLRHLGRRRTDRLYDWLLQVNSGLKGGSQLPARTLLERLVIQLARTK
jgi:DNA polymerase-3 subunit delta